jgi:putative NADH-flavin reductase
LKLLVLGAAGPTGQLLVAQAREQGHQVTGFVRATHGDATDRAALARVVPGHDAIVSTLGRRAFKSANLMQNAMRALVPAMERAGVRRLVVMSSLGVGETLRDVPLIPRLMYRLFLTDLFADKKAAEDYLRGTALDWTFVYPVQLTDGPRTGRYRVGERFDLSGMPKVSRADVADFMLKELRERAYVRKTAVISS